MVLDEKTVKKICDFVQLKPRTVQEVSEHIKKNWRTAERYVEKIKQETGCMSTRTFREGTRGALKIVFWNALEDISSTSIQQELMELIMRIRQKGDFQVFDIYQYVDEKKKRAYIEDASSINYDYVISDKQDLVSLFRQAQKQILIFSGNLSWVNCHQGKIQMIDAVREAVKKGVSFKILGRVSMIGEDNAKKLLAINKELGKDMIEIRHRYQPLRCIIVDNKVIKFREKKKPSFYKPGELKKEIEIFYDISDKEWIDWLQKVFWKMFSTAMPAEKRIKEIEKIQNKIFD